MAKHHGIKFANGDSLRSACEAVGSNGRDIQSPGGYFYLHPDSLPLLEPRPGDILVRAGIEEHVTMHNLFLFIHRAPDTEHLFEGFHEKGGMIIQRNGLPFHWPQAEQAP
jgi:hypothetical protein